ncbi:hypothetical protein PQO03_06805 [Lentisphaera profundi]|uniref:Uncharacterized protein n=1 Tax=Lentisphaera profundi TaxID=1658616 RepID=A0ABY7VQA3_9BACT|nr:hypothetical protein [Lentisphaera profundi]WDE95425.1 hypothetical protein PQO03_06805 [Lentisphaera profundi]
MIYLLYAIFYLLLVFLPLRKQSSSYALGLFILSLLMFFISRQSSFVYLYSFLLMPYLCSLLISQSISTGLYCLALSLCRFMNFLGFDKKRLGYLLSSTLMNDDKDLPQLSYGNAAELKLILNLCRQNKQWGELIDNYKTLSQIEKKAYFDLYSHANEQLEKQKILCDQEL